MATDPAKPCLRFGPFLLDLPARRLLRGQSPVRLGGRALDLLAALLEHPGEILTRQALVSRVWPSSFVEESSLRVHIAALRRALGDGEHEAARYITTVPGRGYGFVGSVIAVERVETLRPSDPRSPALPALPVLVAPRAFACAAPGPDPDTDPDALIGRENELAALAEVLHPGRLLTLVGAGGIGKTRMALALAARESPRFPDGHAVIDLSPVAGATALASTVAARLGLMAPGADPLSALIEGLRDRSALIVLDNCEHLLDAAAALARALLAHAPTLGLLATSREPLDVPDELAWVLPPLALLEADNTPPDTRADRREAAPSPAARLFLARAESAGAIGLRVADRALIESLCDRLDGLPLALELAAARLPALGLNGLLQRLELVLGHAPPSRGDARQRHRSLEALIDWSDSLLEPSERAVLHRLSVFRQDFSHDEALTLAADAGIPPEDVDRALRQLVRKSLLTALCPEPGPAPVTAAAPARYRLLFATRAYAERRLAASPDQAEWAVRHARHVHGLLVRAGRELHALDRDRLGAWHRRHAGVLDELRAAVSRNLATSDDGRALRAALSVIAAARPLILEYGLFAEAMPWIERGLSLVTSLTPPDPALELQLRITACFCGVIEGRGGARPNDAFSRTLSLARTHGDRAARVDAMFGLLATVWGLGEHRRMLPLLEELRTLLPDRAGSPGSVLLVGRHQAMHDFFEGRFDAARRQLDAMAALPTRRLHRRYLGHSPRAAIHAQFVARILWIQGRGEEADAVIEAALEQLDPLMPLAPGVVIGMAAIPVAIWQGRDARARERLDRLSAHVERHRQRFWPPALDCLRWALEERASRGDPGSIGTGLHEHDPRTLPVLPPPPLPTRLAEHQLGTFGLPWVTEASVRRARAGEVGWAAAELIRAHAALRLTRLPEISAPGEAVAASSALAATLDAIDADLALAATLARAQGAAAWSLRVAMTQARLWRRQHRAEDAARVLETALAALEQGHDDADPLAARALLADLTGDRR